MYGQDEQDDAAEEGDAAVAVVGPGQGRLDGLGDREAGHTTEQRAERRGDRHVLEAHLEQDDEDGEHHAERHVEADGDRARGRPRPESGSRRPAVNVIAATNNVRASMNQVIGDLPVARPNELRPGWGEGAPCRGRLREERVERVSHARTPPPVRRNRWPAGRAGRYSL